MDKITHEEISQRVAVYRELKAQMDALKVQMDAIKANVMPIVELHGNWKDAEGYARQATRATSISYPSKAIDGLAGAWSVSEDPIINSCGQMLFQHRRIKAGSTYLQIK